MLRRFFYVPLAVLGAAVAFAVSGAGGATVSELLVLQNRLTQLDANGDASCAAGSTHAIDVTLYSGGSVDQNGTGSDVFLWLGSTASSVRLTDHPTRTGFDAHVDNPCRFVGYSTFTPPSTNDARLFDLMTGVETTIATGAVVEDLSGDGRYVVTLSQSTGQMTRHRIDGSEPPVVVTLDSAENPLAGSSFNASISADGAKVAFQNFQTSPQIYVRDIDAGTTELISEMSGVPSGGLAPTINQAGTFVAYLRPGTIPETGILRHLATGMDVVLGPVDDAPDVNDAGTVAFVTPAALDPADTNGENDAYTLALSGDATWLSRPVGGGAPSGGSYPFVGDVHVANGDAAAVFTSNRTNLGGATGVETGYRATIGTTGGGGSTSTSTTTTTTPTAPDIGVVKTVAPPADGHHHRPLEALVYTVTVTNHGNAATSTITLSDTVSTSDTGGGAPIVAAGTLPVECEATQTIPEDPIDIACELTPLLPGESEVVTYSVVASAPGQVQNAVTVATSGDANSGNNHDDLSVVIVEPGVFLGGDAVTPLRVDLAVFKSVVEPGIGNAFSPNEPITFTVEIVNQGTLDARGVVLRDRIGAPRSIEISLVPESVRGAENCTLGDLGDRDTPADPFSLTCELGDIAANGGRKVVTYAVRSPFAGEFRNDAEAGSVGPEANPGDNFDGVRFTVDNGKRNCDGRRALAAANQDVKCALTDGDEEVECSDAICFAGRGNDRLDCTAGAVCSGGPGEDRYRCSGEGTVCSGGADDDVGTCLDEARCKEDGSDDLIACIRTSQCDLGGGDDRVLCRFSVCRGMAGADFIRCDRSRCYGGTGRDVIRGGAGVETIYADDGQADDIDCGEGDRDLVVVDSKDRTKNCEFVLGADVVVSPTLSRVAGGTLTFRALYRNDGPAAATNVVLTLIATVTGPGRDAHTLESASGDCVVERIDSDGTATRYAVRCRFPSLASGARGSVFLKFNGNDDTQGFMAAEISAAEPDHRPANNESLISTTP